MKWGSKNIVNLQYGGKSIIKAVCGSKIVWEKSGQMPDIPEEPEDTPGLITFTIGGVEYHAEEGMTWEKWVNSEYNHAFSDSFTPFTIKLINGDYTVLTKSDGGTDGEGVQHTFSKTGRKVDPVSVSEVIESKEYYLFIIFNI